MEQIHTADIETYVYILLVIGAWLFKTLKNAMNKNTGDNFLPEKDKKQGEQQQPEYLKELLKDLEVLPPEQEPATKEDQEYIESIDETDYSDDKIDEIIDKHEHRYEDIIAEVKSPTTAESESVEGELPTDKTSGFAYPESKKQNKARKLLEEVGARDAMVLKEILTRKHF